MSVESIPLETGTVFEGHLVIPQQPRRTKSSARVTFDLLKPEKVGKAANLAVSVADRIFHSIGQNNIQVRNLGFFGEVLHLSKSIQGLPQSCQKFFDAIGDESKTKGEIFLLGNACVSPLNEVAKFCNLTKICVVPGFGILKILAPISLVLGKFVELCKLQFSKEATVDDIQEKTRSFDVLLKIIENVFYVAIGVLSLVLLAVQNGCLLTLIPAVVAVNLPNVILICSVSAFVLNVLGYYCDPKSWELPPETAPGVS